MTDNDSNNEINFDHLNTYVAGDVDLTAELFSLFQHQVEMWGSCLLYTSPSPRDRQKSRMPSSA